MTGRRHAEATPGTQSVLRGAEIYVKYSKSASYVFHRSKKSFFRSIRAVAVPDEPPKGLIFREIGQETRPLL
jgi:hypothetical protein